MTLNTEHLKETLVLLPGFIADAKTLEATLRAKFA